MKNFELIQTIKIVFLGFVLGLSVSFVFAQWTVPAGAPTTINNAPIPINVSSNPQGKNSNPPTGSLLDIGGILSSTNMVVFDNTIIHGDVTIPSLKSSSSDVDQWVCVNSAGDLIVCN